VCGGHPAAVCCVLHCWLFAPALSLIERVMRVGVCRVLSVYGSESDSAGGCCSSHGKYVACNEMPLLFLVLSCKAVEWHLTKLMSPSWVWFLDFSINQSIVLGFLLYKSFFDSFIYRYWQRKFSEVRFKWLKTRVFGNMVKFENAGFELMAQWVCDVFWSWFWIRTRVGGFEKVPCHWIVVCCC